MIIIIEPDPKFVAIKDMTLYTSKGEVFIEQGSPVGLLRTESGALHLGKAVEGVVTEVLEFNNKTVINDLMEHCQPSTFELIRDSEGDSAIKPVLLEEKFLIEQKLDRISLCESLPTHTLNVQKIR